MSWCRVAAMPRRYRTMNLSSTTHGFIFAKIHSMKNQVSMNAASAIGAWLSEESRTFTAICGEKFTRAEVILTCMGTAALILSVIMGVKLASWLAGGVV